MHKKISVILAILAIGAGPIAAAQDGQQKAAVCGACHGLTGNSPASVWPSLAGQHPRYTVDQLRAYKNGTRHAPEMDAMSATLTEQDMQDIAAFFANQQPAIQSIAEDQAASGAALYRGGNMASGVPACMACHGPNGAGNALAGYPALRGQQFDYTVKQLTGYRDGTRTTDPNSMMRMIAGRLTNAELESVARYVSALH